MTDSTLGDRIGPKRAELFREIFQAWLSTTADDRQPIEARAMDGDLRLLHPGFSGRDVTVRFEDVDALVAEGLLSQAVYSVQGDRRIEPSRGAIDAFRASQQPTSRERRIGFDTPDDA
jgi:hypothetical protein